MNIRVIKNGKSLQVALIVSIGAFLFLDICFIIQDFRILGLILAIMAITLIILIFLSMFKKIIINGADITIVYAPFLKRKKIDSCRYVHAVKYNRYSCSDAIILSYKKVFWFDLTQELIGDEKFNWIVDYIIQNNIKVDTIYSSQWEKIVLARKNKKNLKENQKSTIKLDNRSFKELFIHLLLRVSPIALATILYGAIVPNIDKISIDEIVAVLIVYIIVVFIYAIIIYGLNSRKKRGRKL